MARWSQRNPQAFGEECAEFKTESVFVWSAASMAGALAVVRPQMRGVMTSVVNFVYSLLGAGLGGLIVGLLNDVLEPRYGDQAIRYSLLIMPVASTIATVSYYLGSRTLDRDAKRAESPVYAPPST